MKSGKKTKLWWEKQKQRLDDFCSRILVVSSDSIPGQDVVEVLGHVTGTSNLEVRIPEDTDTAERLVMARLMKNALEMGVKAVSHSGVSSSTHRQQGSQWIVSEIFLV